MVEEEPEGQVSLKWDDDKEIRWYCFFFNFEGFSIPSLVLFIYFLFLSHLFLFIRSIFHFSLLLLLPFAI
jgi:hypothetical protein